jgi:hypothetical protein
MDWRLYNLAVGGSRITRLIADQTTAVQADMISIPWGFNGWNLNRDMDELGSDYKNLIVRLRSYHPNAYIYRIMPIATTRLSPAYGGSPIYGLIDTLRKTERRVVKSLIAKGDKKCI